MNKRHLLLTVGCFAVIALIVVFVFVFGSNKTYPYTGVVGYGNEYLTWEYTGSLAVPLPSNVLAGQVGKRYMIGRLVFQFILQPTKNTVLPDFDPLKQRVQYVGILVYNERDDKLQRLFSIKPKYVAAKTWFLYNPAAVFKKDNQMIVDIVNDARDEGSDGDLIRFSYDLKSEKRNEIWCFRYRMSEFNVRVDGIALPYTLEKKEKCDY